MSCSDTTKLPVLKSRSTQEQWPAASSLTSVVQPRLQLDKRRGLGHSTGFRPNKSDVLTCFRISLQLLFVRQIWKLVGHCQQSYIQHSPLNLLKINLQDYCRLSSSVGCVFPHSSECKSMCAANYMLAKNNVGKVTVEM